MKISYLVGGLEHESMFGLLYIYSVCIYIYIWLVVSKVWIIFHFIYGMSSFPLTNSIIFRRGRSTTSQVFKLAIFVGMLADGEALQAPKLPCLTDQLARMMKSAIRTDSELPLPKSARWWQWQ